MAIELDFKRPLYPPDDPLYRGGATGTVGEDVLAVKIAISRAGYWPWQEFDEAYSNRFSHGVGVGSVRIRSGVAGFQRENGIDPTGWYGKLTHEKLLKKKVPSGKPHAGEWAWDFRARALYKGFEDTSPEEKIVADIYKWWDQLIADEDDWHYSQDRPVQPLIARENPPKPPGYLDCSGTAIYTAWLAGANSPDVYHGYGGYGNTNSLNDGGLRISVSEINKYAKDHLVLAFYGPSIYNTKHVVSCKSDTEIYSMGREGAPEKKNSIYHWKNFLEARAYRVL